MKVRTGEMRINCAKGRHRSTFAAQMARKIARRMNCTCSIIFIHLWSGVRTHSGRVDDRGPCGCHVGACRYIEQIWDSHRKANLLRAERECRIANHERELELYDEIASDVSRYVIHQPLPSLPPVVPRSKALAKFPPPELGTAMQDRPWAKRGLGGVVVVHPTTTPFLERFQASRRERTLSPRAREDAVVPSKAFPKVKSAKRPPPELVEVENASAKPQNQKKAPPAKALPKSVRPPKAPPPVLASVPEGNEGNELSLIHISEPTRPY